MQTKKLMPSVGRILISEPFISDMYFKRSVVLMIDHSEDGSFGVILNKPVASLVCDVVEGFPDVDARIYLGGPVRTDSLFFIHRLGDIIKGSIIINGDIAWGGDLTQIRKMIEEGKMSKNDIRFFLGYSGWTKNQLNEELELNSWVVSNKKIDKIIDVDPDKMWEYSLKQLSPDYSDWVNYPVDPTLN